MAITLTALGQNTSAAANLALLDGGTIEVQESDDTLLAVGTYGTPAFGAPSTGTASANAITRDEDAAASGTAAKFLVKTSGGAEVFRGTVGLEGSGADMIVSTTTVVEGQPFEFSSMTYTQPAS